ncbi:hypothetical protein GCM10023170_001870 [Phytohabitans houttuyneae]|uniref:DUF6923 family protein n=1 Tax=Phytohabitans houttuyneae TaxID=1076126 RepID=UPI0031E6209B
MLAALVALGAGPALAGHAAAAPAKSTVEAYPSGCSGALYQVHTVRKHGSSRLIAIDPATGAVARSAGLDHAVNAMGYDAAQGLFFAVATRRGGHPIGDGGHVVSITPEGETHDLGPVRAAAGRKGTVAVGGAYSGTVVDGRLLLLLDGDLVAVDVRAQSPTFLHVVRRVDLPRLPSFGDWDARPGDGGLYAVSTQGREPSRLVRIDPDSGAVTQTPVPDLSRDGFYGALAFDDAGTHAYATDNNQESALYRIALDGTSVKLAGGSGLLGSDAAWCRGPRPTTPAPATTRPAPPPAPAAVPPAVPPPAPPRPVPPASAPTTPPATTPPPSPTPVAAVKASRKRMVVAEPREDDRTTTVRWGIVLLVLGLGGVAFARPVAKPIAKLRGR